MQSQDTHTHIIAKHICFTIETKCSFDVATSPERWMECRNQRHYYRCDVPSCYGTCTSALTQIGSKFLADTRTTAGQVNNITNHAAKRRLMISDHNMLPRPHWCARQFAVDVSLNVVYASSGWCLRSGQFVNSTSNDQQRENRCWMRNCVQDRVHPTAFAYQNVMVISSWRSVRTRFIHFTEDDVHHDHSSGKD